MRRGFMQIKPGDTPETNEATKAAAEWISEWIDRIQAAFKKRNHGDAVNRQKRPTVGDLRTVPKGTIQLCRTCGGQYSAYHGDYVFAERGDATPLTCCGRAVALVIPRMTYRVVRAAVAGLALAVLLSGCGGSSPTAPSPTPPPAPVCRDVFHPEIRETVPRIVNGVLVFVVIITPAWTETICE